MNTVLIGVCTAQRPQMLHRCLNSLAAQQVPDDVSPVLAVVDNEAEPNNRAAVKSFAAECPFPVHYIHEPRPGIPIARNRVLDEALDLGADWIAFIDDDETAAPDWLAMLMAPEYRNTSVLMGKQVMVPPEPAPFWYVPTPQKRGEGDVIASAYTHNVRFHADITRAGFRFDEAFRFTGGSDAEYFRRAHKAGYEIRYTLKAQTFEDIHRERLTWRFIVARRRRCVAGAAQRRAMHGDKTISWRKAPSMIFDMLRGAAGMCFAAIAFPFNRTVCKSAALKAADRIGRAAGRFVFLTGNLPEPYREIHGQ